MSYVVYCKGSFSNPYLIKNPFYEIGGKGAVGLKYVWGSYSQIDMLAVFSDAHEVREAASAATPVTKRGSIKTCTPEDLPILGIGAPTATECAANGNAVRQRILAICAGKSPAARHG